MQEQKATTKPSITLSTDFWDDPRILSLRERDRLMYIGVLIMNRKGFIDRLKEGLGDYVMSQLLRIDEEYVDELKEELKLVGLIDDNWKPVKEI